LQLKPVIVLLVCCIFATAVENRMAHFAYQAWEIAETTIAAAAAAAAAARLPRCQAQNLTSGRRRQFTSIWICVLSGWLHLGWHSGLRCQLFSY
jgi:hypothetical protein